MDIQELFERMLKIIWFSNFGNKLNQNINFNINYAKNIEECKNYYTDINWEETTLEARNMLTEFLHNKYQKDYSKWNVHAKEGKIFLEKNIIPKIELYCKQNNLDKVFIDCVEWDLLGVIMESYYCKIKNKPTFFEELFKIYENGNFPCGWVGKYPNGSLIVF